MPRIIPVLEALTAHYGIELPLLGKQDPTKRQFKMLWDKAEPQARWPAAKSGSEAFRVLIGTILSQRTRDERTEAASEALFARYPTAPVLAKAPLRSVERLVRPANFYKTKARTVRKAAQALLKEHGGRVPLEREQLLRIPGVGPKTAACVLVYGHQLPAIPVDTHVHRISNRLGWVKTESPEGTEAALERLVPKAYWMQVNELLVRHGQGVCKPIGPRCGACPVARHCQYGKAQRK